jgi:lipopolysaccharide/colanic/teichoic acid biosynthesis glycosyltransferase
MMKFNDIWKGLVARIIKRFIDIIISFIMIILLLPLYFIIGLSIKISSKGKVLFTQKRIGLYGKEFVLYKFRTMKEGAEKETVGKYITGNEEVLTPVGKFLRRWALDELPQLFNVLKGDMSVVGPRPALPYQVERYNERQRKRLEMKPGLTGWAQVNGRNKLTWPGRIEYDVWYVENWSLWLDFKIMFLTIQALLRKNYAFSDENIVEDEIVRKRDF